MSKRKRRRHSSSRSRTGIGSFLRRPSVQMIALVIVAIIIYFTVLGGGESPGGSVAQTHEISPQQAYQKYQAGAFLLDVRSQQEWNKYRVPDSTLIPLEQLQARLGELPQDKDIVVVCGIGQRSRQGAEILLSAGFTRVTSITGGLKAWSDLGYPIEGTRP